jgi:hypothetical protein
MKIIFKKYNHLNIESILLRLGSNGDVFAQYKSNQLGIELVNPMKKRKLILLLGIILLKNQRQDYIYLNRLQRRFTFGKLMR